VGTTVRARFTLSLTGTFAYNMAAGASPAEASYDVESPAGTIATGYYSTGSGASGEQNIGNYASFTFDDTFTIGTPFDVTLQMINGTAIDGIGTGSSYAHVDLTLTNVGLEAIDGMDVPIAGSFSTLSGHDYTMAPVPEPLESEFAPALAALGVAWQIRRRRSRMRAAQPPVDEITA
jgi:hypothetical protein